MNLPLTITNTNTVDPDKILQINRIMNKYHKIYIRDFRYKVLAKRIGYLTDREIGQYIFQKMKDLKDEQHVF